MSEFKKRVVEIVQAIPYGKVMSYGQVASYAGAPRGARQIGWILHQLDDVISVPWWRVVNNQGRISIKSFAYTPQVMKELLEQEGVVIKQDFTFDIEKYRYKATDNQLKKWRLSERYLEKMNAKYLRNLPR